MLVQRGLCCTCLETTLLVFSRHGSYIIIFNISWIVEKLKIISNFDYKLTCFTSVNMHYQETACQFKKDLQDVVVFFCKELIELELRHEKSGFLLLRKQRRRPASR